MKTLFKNPHVKSMLTKIWDDQKYDPSEYCVKSFKTFTIELFSWRIFSTYNWFFFKSVTFSCVFLIFGHVKMFVGPSSSFWTPNFLSGVSGKSLHFTITFYHKLIFSIHLPSKMSHEHHLSKLKKISLWSKAIIKLKPFSESPTKR